MDKPSKDFGPVQNNYSAHVHCLSKHTSVLIALCFLRLVLSTVPDVYYEASYIRQTNNPVPKVVPVVVPTAPTKVGQSQDDWEIGRPVRFVSTA
eukprot:4991655-Amphidinium_carterae.1